MSEVQKILRDNIHTYADESLELDDAEQALYDLLMENAEDQGYGDVVPVSIINELFGRTE